MHIALALNRRGKSIAFDMIEHMIRFSTTTNDKRKPWEKANEYGEMPGDICCQRASSEFCYSHDKDNYPVEHSVLLKRIGYIFLCVVVIAINIWYLKHVWN